MKPVLVYRAKWIVQTVKLPGGWFGLGADEGRAKQRNALGRRMEPEIQGCPNGTSCHLLTLLRERKPGELKHLSTRRKRNQARCR